MLTSSASPLFPFSLWALSGRLPPTLRAAPRAWPQIVGHLSLRPRRFSRSPVTTRRVLAREGVRLEPCPLAAAQLCPPRFLLSPACSLLLAAPSSTLTPFPDRSPTLCSSLSRLFPGSSLAPGAPVSLPCFPAVMRAVCPQVALGFQSSLPSEPGGPPCSPPPGFGFQAPAPPARRPACSAGLCPGRGPHPAGRSLAVSALCSHTTCCSLLSRPLRRRLRSAARTRTLGACHPCLLSWRRLTSAGFAPLPPSSRPADSPCPRVLLCRPVPFPSPLCDSQQVLALRRSLPTLQAAPCWPSLPWGVSQAGACAVSSHLRGARRPLSALPGCWDPC